MRRPLLWICGFAFLLAGCVGDSSSPAQTKGTETGTSPSSTIGADYESDEALAAAGKGAIDGYVHDDYNVTMPGAHVALLAGGYSADADKDGFFRINNVTPKTYTARVDFEGFDPVVEEVEVKLGKVVHLDVVFVRPFDPNATFISVPHKHDWWGADKEVVIQDRDIYMGPTTVCVGVLTDNACGASGGAAATDGESYIDLLPPEDVAQRPNVVYQGAGRLHLHVEVEGKVVVPFAIEYQAANADWAPLMTVTGEDAEADVTVNESMADASHVRLSAWRFHVTPADNDVAGVEAKADLYGTRMHWTVTIHRSDRPIKVEEPHPDYWGSDVNRTLLYETKGFDVVRVGSAVPAVDLYLGSGDGVGLPESKTVTIGADRMRVTVNWTPQPVSVRLGLEYTDASMDADDITTRWARAANGQMDGADRRVFELQLHPYQWDSPYATKSRWNFRCFFDDPTTGNDGRFAGNVTYRVEIFKIGT